LEDSAKESVAGSGYGSGRGSYLNSHRALSALTREFTRLGDEIIELSGALPLPLDEKPVIRRSPERTILQLGPVAVTLGWLRSTLDSVGDGQLLVVVWRGTIAGRTRPSPERPTAAAEQTASVIWETTFVAEAPSEEAWVWKPANGEGETFTSSSLAAECIARLRTALEG